MPGTQDGLADASRRSYTAAVDRSVAGRMAGPAAGTTRPSTLSVRELEVARLVATGATNREIAAALAIAPKTASAHIEHILRKLGVARRAQIAAWVARR
jgi:DNA-binding CsgD family transcriptional regulator